MNNDQLKGRIEQAKGKVKEVAGKVVGSEKLETEGLQKFDDSWAELKQTVSDALAEA